MRKWEYKYDTLKDYISILKNFEILSKRSLEGWELVSTVMIELGSGSRMHFYWKREIIEIVQDTLIEWISVKDRLPTENWCESDQEYIKGFSRLVNVMVDNGSVGTAAYNRISEKWFLGDLTKEHYREFENTNVTHWQPLPKKIR